MAPRYPTPQQESWNDMNTSDRTRVFPTGILSAMAACLALSDSSPAQVSVQLGAADAARRLGSKRLRQCAPKQNALASSLPKLNPAGAMAR